MKQPDSHIPEPLLTVNAPGHLTWQDHQDLRNGITEKITRQQLIDNARLVGNPTPACIDGLSQTRATGKNRRGDSVRGRRRAFFGAMMDKKLDL